MSAPNTPPMMAMRPVNTGSRSGWARISAASPTQASSPENPTSVLAVPALGMKATGERKIVVPDESISVSVVAAVSIVASTSGTSCSQPPGPAGTSPRRSALDARYAAARSAPRLPVARPSSRSLARNQVWARSAIESTAGAGCWAWPGRVMQQRRASAARAGYIQESPGGVVITEEEVRSMLRRVKDPELNLNIVDLGLVYEIEVTEGKDVHVNMT